MLNLLDEAGADALNTFDDRDSVLGWFGWRVDDDVLTVTYEGYGMDEKQIATWRLVEYQPS
jgi:hypothetical protein